MIWSIAPKRGLGPLTLGMSTDEVVDLPGMGRPGHVYRGMGGRAMEYRGLDVPICEYRDGKLCRIVAGRHVTGVQFAGVDLFAAQPRIVLRFLESRLGPVTMCAEQLYFADAQISLGGFYDTIDHACFDPAVEYHDERSIALFAAGESGVEEEAHEAMSFI